jgi:hypothetical protein
MISVSSNAPQSSKRAPLYGKRHARAPRLAHTLSGQLCGGAQAALLGCALAPHRWQQVVDGPRRLLLPLTAALAAASGVSRVLRFLNPLTRGSITKPSWIVSTPIRAAHG